MTTVHFAESLYYDENYNNLLYVKVKPNSTDMVKILKENIKGVKWQLQKYSKLNEQQQKAFHKLAKENEYVVINDNMRVLKDGTETR